MQEVIDAMFERKVSYMLLGCCLSSCVFMRFSCLAFSGVFLALIGSVVK